MELALALDALRRGDSYVSPSISRTVLTQMLSGATNAQRSAGSESASVQADAAQRSTTPTGAPLTRRQMQVLTLIAKGLANKQIAKALELSVKTIETYRTQIIQRLNIRDVAGLTLYAARNGLVSL